LTVTIQGVPGLHTIARQLRDTALPSGALGKAVAAATQAYAQGTARNAHRDTGTMAGAQTAEVSGLMGRVYTASTSNPKTGLAASTYAPYEEGRGGPHAFYNTTYQQDTPRILGDVEQILFGALP
jgi:hypothetical protein